MERSPYFSQVSSRYLFQEVKERRAEFLKREPTAKLISLSIGDTTEPIAPHTLSGLVDGATRLGAKESYQGYGPEQGIEELRTALSEKIYKGIIPGDDIFVSDGAKCDIGRLQILFGPHARIALQDPAYPAYLDTAAIYRGKGALTFLKCLPENNFFPDLKEALTSDILFLCAPNNPTGAAFSYKKLTEIVEFARKNGKIIVFDTAYSFYISKSKENTIPRSIYEIPHAKEVAIEIGSFSKIAGFSGVRLGWTVIPQELRYATGEAVKPDWMRIITTFYNGASSISQRGGLAALSDTGLQEIEAQVAFYLENVAILREAFIKAGFEVHGGIHAPYLWIRKAGKATTSWQAFDELLEKAHLLTTPGVGFGPAGEGFLRISGFGNRATILDAAARITTLK